MLSAPGYQLFLCALSIVAASCPLHARHAWGCLPQPLSFSRLRVDTSSVYYVSLLVLKAAALRPISILPFFF